MSLASELYITVMSNEPYGVLNHQPLNCLFNILFWLTSKKISKFPSLALCEGNPPVTGGFPSQRASNEESISISWWHECVRCNYFLVDCFMTKACTAAIEVQPLELGKHAAGQQSIQTLAVEFMCFQKRQFLCISTAVFYHCLATPFI